MESKGEDTWIEIESSQVLLLLTIESLSDDQLTKEIADLSYGHIPFISTVKF